MSNLSFLLETIKLIFLLYFNSWWSDLSNCSANAEIHKLRKFKGKNKKFTCYMTTSQHSTVLLCGHVSVMVWHLATMVLLVCRGNHCSIIFKPFWVVYPLASTFLILNINNGSILIILFLDKKYFLIMLFLKVRSFTIN